LLRRTIGIAVGGCLCCGILVSASTSAWAEGVISDAWCEPSKPGCTARAGTTTAAGERGTRIGGADGSGSRSSRPCTSGGQVVPCSLPVAGAMRSGCYQRPVSSPAAGLPVEPFLSGSRAASGSWLLRTCQGASGWTTAWVPGGAAGDGPAPAPAPPPPIVIAREAVSQLRLSAPPIASNPGPGAMHLVSLPTWLWIDRSQWQPQSTTASVPGVSVTVTATPTRIEWEMGDGSTVTCNGPGTPYPPDGDPRAASPDCGHTYTRSSAGLPGEQFPVTARVFWRIAWSGGGQAGSLPELQTTSSAAFQVAESQALVAAGG
jgi:hypothetical protein